jgi:hypothetical protein
MLRIETQTVDREAIIPVFWRLRLKHPVVMLRSRQRKNVVDKEAVLHGRDRQVYILRWTGY